MFAFCCGIVPRQKGANYLDWEIIRVIPKLFEKNLN
jgi:hypothetical protein